MIILGGLAVVVLGLFCWFTAAGQAQTPLPGSEADPLISRSYLESYVNERLRPLEAQIAALSERVTSLERQLKEVQQRPATSVAARIALRVGSRTAYVGTQAYQLERAPYMEGSTVMVPFRFIGEALGAEVRWEAATKRVLYRRGSVSLAFQLGQKWVEVNGERRGLEVPPRLVDGTTMVPLRVVTEYLGARVNWDPVKKEVTID